MKLRNIVLYVFCTCVLSVLSYSGFCQVKVGHRGSIWGLENSRVSFINGARMGFGALECDIRASKDGIFIISHDEDFVRLGADSTVVVANKTAAELLAVPLSQVRSNGLYYEGSCITLDDYLEICKQYSCIPVIEVKWCHNIYSNNNNPKQYSYDGVPALMSLIKSHGLEHEAIILTSMKGVLEFIRANYPAANLQLLSRQNWKDHVEWCQKNRIDIDVQNGGDNNTGDLVKTFHGMGLKVNVWTVDDSLKKKQMTDAGVDMITSNL